jgi:hypothetical protein
MGVPVGNVTLSLFLYRLLAKGKQTTMSHPVFQCFSFNLLTLKEHPDDVTEGCIDVLKVELCDFCGIWFLE